MMGRVWKCVLPAVVATALLVVLSPGDLLAQAAGPPSFRPFWHVFVAYAIAWLLVLGWLISIARRLGRVEERMGRQADQTSA